MLTSTLLASTKFSLLATWEVLLALPRIFAIRRSRPPKSAPSILLFSKFGDEVNGIARSTRELIHVLSNRKRAAIYITPAHSSRNRVEWETEAVCIVPLAVSLDTPGYPGSEMAFPRLQPLMKIIRERGITHVDILTPSLG